MARQSTFTSQCLALRKRDAKDSAKKADHRKTAENRVTKGGAVLDGEIAQRVGELGRMVKEVSKVTVQRRSPFLIASAAELREVLKAKEQEEAQAEGKSELQKSIEGRDFDKVRGENL